MTAAVVMVEAAMAGAATAVVMAAEATVVEKAAETAR